jgi:hypothetical protein
VLALQMRLLEFHDHDRNSSSVRAYPELWLHPGRICPRDGQDIRSSARTPAPAARNLQKNGGTVWAGFYRRIWKNINAEINSIRPTGPPNSTESGHSPSPVTNYEEELLNFGYSPMRGFYFFAELGKNFSRPFQFAKKFETRSIVFSVRS